MIKNTLPLMITLASCLCAPLQAEDLTIAAGQTYTATGDLQLEHLVMEEGATLIAPAGISEWKIEVTRASLIGKSYIRASGEFGAAGKHAASVTEQAAPCATGVTGYPGSAGGGGQAGTNIQVIMGVTRFDHLEIDSRGGNGGNGGSGSDGGNGGKARGCNGGDGGNGGNGGDGGDGGNGGDVTFQYRLTNAQVKLPITNYGEGLIITTAGGHGGISGRAGLGGKGGKGKFEKRTTNITVTRESGLDGKPGRGAQAGARRPAGRFRITTFKGSEPFSASHVYSDRP